MAFDISNTSAYESAASATREAQQSKGHSGPGVYALYGKRVFDVLFVLAVSPIVVPVIFLLWVIVKKDGGPGFYKQTRVGMNGKVFEFWKLRSMVVDADKVLADLCEKDPAIAHEWKTNQKLENDPRITRIGRIIRATSLDELPQVFNVLIGDMSIVGPRPFMTDQAEIYRAAGGQKYFDMRPGITGPWQVSGRGETTFIARVRYDNFYARFMTFVKDITYIIRTVTVVFSKTGH